MKNLYLDPTTFDLALKDFNLQFTSNLTEYVSQKIENVLNTFEEEWFLDFTIGIPYLTRILIKNPDLNDVNNIFLIAITSIAEVEEILEFDASYDGNLRKYIVDYKIKASDGIATETITGTVPIGGR